MGDITVEYTGKRGKETFYSGCFTDDGRCLRVWDHNGLNNMYIPLHNIKSVSMLPTG